MGLFSFFKKRPSPELLEQLGKTTICDHCSKQFNAGKAATRAKGGYLKIECPNCGRYVIFQVDGDLSFLKEEPRRKCNYCGDIIIGEVLALPEGRRTTFEMVIGKHKSRSYEKDAAGKPVWIVCNNCARKAHKVLNG